MSLTNKNRLTDRNRLSIVNPLISEEWNYDKNYPLTPKDVSIGSHIRAWWKCKKCQHEWQTRVGHRNEGQKCPRCIRIYHRLNKSLCETNPKLMKEWHPTKNLPLQPSEIGRGSEKNVWWKCRNGHEWQAVIYGRANGNGCPFCSGRRVNKENCLRNAFPKIAAQWHPTKNGNLTPENTVKGSHERVWWKDPKCGHEWQAYICTRTSQNNQCPYCQHSLLSPTHNLLFCNPSVAKQWHPTKNGKLTPDKITPLANTVVWWKCRNGHEWKTRVSHISRGSSGCPYCSKIPLKDGTFFSSLTEAFWYLQFKKLGYRFLHNKTYNSKAKDKMGKRRYDFYFPDFNFYIEVTSFNKEWKKWKAYREKIAFKQNYVRKQLGGSFAFFQYVLKEKDKKLVEQHIKR